MSSLFDSALQAATANLFNPSAAGAGAYLHGAFLVSGDAGNTRRAIPFLFNPESITRTVAVESGQHSRGVEGATQSAAAAPPHQEASADAASGTPKESFTIQIRLDLAYRSKIAGSVTADQLEQGVAPEIAAIEDLMYPVAPPPNSDGRTPTSPASARPTVLFVWGRKRVVPVRITSLKIDESMYNGSLNPVRAEIEASLEVLGPADALNDGAVRSALAATNANRAQLRETFYASTGTQGSQYLALWPKDPK